MGDIPDRRHSILARCQDCKGLAATLKLPKPHGSLAPVGADGDTLAFMTVEHGDWKADCEKESDDASLGNGEGLSCSRKS